MQQIINILISLTAFLFAVFIAGATEIDLVLRVVILAFIIQWIAFLPAYIFQTEKFDHINSHRPIIKLFYAKLL